MAKKRKMRVISRGSESKERFDLLLSQSGITSGNSIGALYDHLVKGSSISVACVLNSMSTSNLERDVLKINDIALFVVAIENYDWDRFRKG